MKQGSKQASKQGSVQKKVLFVKYFHPTVNESDCQTFDLNPLEITIVHANNEM